MPVSVRSICALLFLLAICPSGARAQVSATGRPVAGVVLDGNGEQGIAGAHVRLSASGVETISGADGRFVFESVPPGRYRLTIALEGFQPFEHPAEVVVPADGDPDPLVIHCVLRLAAEVRTVARAPGASETSAGSTLNVVPGRAVALAPGALEDVLRAFQMRPGVAASQDDRNDLLVRGGGAIENATRVDGFDVPNPSHFGAQGGSGGAFSFIAPWLIDRAVLRAGGFPVEFGERASSVLDLRLKDGSDARVHGQAGASVGGAMAEADGPLGEAKGSWLVSARRSFLDLALRRGADVAIPHYSDFVGRLETAISPAHRVELLALGATDNVMVNPDDPSGALRDDQQSVLVGTSVESRWNQATTSRVYLSYARSSIAAVMHGTGADQGIDQSTEIELRARGELTRSIGADGHITAGIGVKHADLRFDLSAKSFVTDYGQFRRPLEAHFPYGFTDGAAYAEVRTPTFGRLQLMPGVRIDRLGTTGRFYTSPRVNAEYQATGRVRLTAATGVYRQNIPYIWMGSDIRNASLSPVRSVQTLAGITARVFGGASFVVEGFDKRYSGYPVDPIEWWHVLVDASADFESPFVGRLSADGKLHARGVDASLARRFSRLDLNGSYSWWRVTQSTRTWPRVFGGSRPGDYDIRNQVRLDLAYEIPGRWRAGAQFRYASGRPYTPHDVRASLANWYGVYGVTDFNASRYPAYHRLDVRFDRTLAIKRTSLVLYAEVENVYDRGNVLLYDWDPEARADRPVFQWGRLPVAGVRWEF